MKNNDIIILPVVRKRPWVNTASFQKNKLMSASTIIQPFYGRDGFQTGLEGNEDLQSQFEKELNMTKDTLKPTVNNDYWHEEMNIKLEDGPNSFSRSNPQDKLKILVLRNHPIIANSFNEINPESQFYIVDEIVESEKKASRAENKAKAYSVLTGMNPSEQRQFLKLYGKGGNDMSERDVNAELGEYLEENVVDFLFKSDYSKETINIRAFIFDLVAYNVLRIRGGDYFDSDENKGNLESLSSYLLAPEKQDIYLNYKERLEHAKHGK